MLRFHTCYTILSITKFSCQQCATLPCGFGPGSKGLLQGGVAIAGVIVRVVVVVVVVVPGSSGGPVSLTRMSSAPPSKEAGPEEEWAQGPGSELGSGSASSTPWWPHGEQDGSRERLFVSKLGLEEEGPGWGKEGEEMSGWSRGHETLKSCLAITALLLTQNDH